MPKDYIYLSKFIRWEWEYCINCAFPMLFCYYFLSFLDLLCNFFWFWASAQYFLFIWTFGSPSSSNALVLLIYSVSMRRLHQWCLFHALLLLISLFLGFTATTVLLATGKEILLQFKGNINKAPYIRLNQNQN